MTRDDFILASVATVYAIRGERISSHGAQHLAVPRLEDMLQVVQHFGLVYDMTQVAVAALKPPPESAPTTDIVDEVPAVRRGRKKG